MSVCAGQPGDAFSNKRWARPRATGLARDRASDSIQVSRFLDFREVPGIRKGAGQIRGVEFPQLVSISVTLGKALAGLMNFAQIEILGRWQWVGELKS